MKAPLSYVPMLPAAVGIGAGILLEAYVSAWLIGAACVVGFTLLYMRGRHYGSFFFLMTMVGAMLALSHREIAPNEMYFSGKHTMLATVSDIGETANGMSMTACVKAIDGQDVPPITCMLYLRGRMADVEDGMTVEYAGHLSPLPEPSVVPYTFDYGQYLRTNGINYTISSAASSVTIVKGPNKAQAIVNACHNTLYNSIVDSPISGKCAAFLLASILGDRQYISQQDKEEYRITGISHILALSGLHVGILASFIALMLLPLQMVRRGYVLRAILVIILVWAYAIIVGRQDSVVRASVMITVFMLSLIIQRGYYPINSLCIAFVVIVAVSPLSIYRPGFQMSFAAVATILAVNKLVPLEARRWRWYNVAATIALPVAAMMGTGMVAAYYYHVFPGMFLLANVIVGLLFPIILTLGYTVMLCTMMGIDFQILGWVVDMLYNVMAWPIAQLASVRFMAVDTYFSGWTLLPYYATIALAIWAIARRNRLIAIGAACMGLITAIVYVGVIDKPTAEMYMPKEMGNCVLTRTPQGAYILPLDSNRTDDILAECHNRYDTFLKQRGCGDSLTIIKAPVSDGYISYRDGVLATTRHVIAVVDDETCDGIRLPRCDYAIVTPSFTGHTQQIIEALRPDTILISAGVAPSRASRLIREAKGGVPILKLRQHAVAWRHD